MLDLTGLGDRAGDQVGTLRRQPPAGEHRDRAARPEVLLLDEPSSALDPRQRERLWEFILRLAQDGTTVVYATHHIQEADRYADRLIVLADGENVFAGPPRELEQATGTTGLDFEQAFVQFLHQRGHRGQPVLWLLLKDLRILRRSPLLVALLVLYPIAIAVLIGVAISRGPDKLEVAIYNGLAGRPAQIELGGREIDRAAEGQRLFDAIGAAQVDSREEAVQKVRDGEVLGALIVPDDLATKLQSGLQPGTVEVVYNAEDPAKRQFEVENTITAQVQKANAALTKRVAEEALQLLELISDGASTASWVRFLGAGAREIGGDPPRAPICPAGPPSARRSTG